MTSLTQSCWFASLRELYFLCNSKKFTCNLGRGIRPSHQQCFARRHSRATPTTLDDSTVRHPSDSFETPNSTINCPRRKVFGIEKVSAKLLPPLDADGHSNFRRTYRENPDRMSTKRAFHSAFNKNKSVEISKRRITFYGIFMSRYHICFVLQKYI